MSRQLQQRDIRITLTSPDDADDECEETLIAMTTRNATATAATPAGLTTTAVTGETAKDRQQPQPPPYSLIVAGRSSSCTVLRQKQQQQQLQQQQQELMARRSSDNSARRLQILQPLLSPTSHQDDVNNASRRSSSARRESRQSSQQGSEHRLGVPGVHGRPSIVSLMSSSGYRISLDRLPDELASLLQQQLVDVETPQQRRQRRQAEEAELPTGCGLLDRLRARYRLRVLETLARPFLIRRSRGVGAGGVEFGGGGAGGGRAAGERYRPPPLSEMVRRTRFSREEVKSLYRAFKQQCPSGLLRRRQFVEALAYLFPMGNPSLFAHYVFNTVDCDRDGVVTTEELVCALSMLTRGSADERMRWVFRLYDVDSDGQISRQDALAVSAAIFDLCGDQVRPAVRPEAPVEKLEQLFGEVQPADPDAITMEEFQRCMEKKFRALPEGVFATPLF